MVPNRSVDLYHNEVLNLWTGEESSTATFSTMPTWGNWSGIGVAPSLVLSLGEELIICGRKGTIQL